MDSVGAGTTYTSGSFYALAMTVHTRVAFNNAISLECHVSCIRTGILIIIIGGGGTFSATAA